MNRTGKNIAIVGPLLLAIGLFMAFAPVFTSGFRLVPGYSIDPRFNHYLMEHIYRWISGNPLHADLWSPPFFYPATNVLGYSDAMIGLGWLYAGFRMLGLSMLMSYTAWVVLLSALNYVLFYAGLRRWLAVTPLAAAVGSLVFAFGVPRMAQLTHPQLLSQAYILLMAHGLLLVMTPSPKRWLGWLLFFGGAVLQFYTAFYHLWFFGCYLALLLLFVGWSATCRGQLLTAVRTPAFPVFALLAVAAAWPLLRIYLEALAMSGSRPMSEIEDMLPGLRSWWYVGDQHRLYGWIYTLWPSLVPPEMTHEHVLGFGPVTMITAWLGLVLVFRKIWARAALCACLAVLVLTWNYSESWNLWFYVVDYVPGAAALRAVTRCALTLMIPLCVGVALALDRVPRTGWRFLLVAMMVLEQGFAVPVVGPEPVERRVGELAAEIRHIGAPVFVAVPVEPGYRRGKEYEFHIDAMWAGMVAGYPVVNGYSGLIPHHWVILYFNTIGAGEDRDRLRQRVAKWVQSNPGDHSSPVVVEWPKPIEENQ